MPNLAPDRQQAEMLEAIKKLPADPILGLTAAYNQDPNPKKIDLGAGVYKDESGNTPIFAAVKQAETLWAAQEKTKVYTPQPGFADFNEQILPLVFGADHDVIVKHRAASVMAPGGSGALRISAELLHRAQGEGNLWVSTPTWGNHIPLLGSAGLQIREYPYYDNATHEIRFDDMLKTLRGLGKSDMVLLHGCCHNPTGADLSREQWQAVAEVAAKQGFVPFIDMAYHGLADGLEEDVYGLRLMAKSVPEMVAAYSCSKNFGLYRERIGAAIVIGRDQTAAETGLSHFTNIARQIYSMPPSHGGAIVKLILQTPDLRASWKAELDAMRTRINSLRALLADTLRDKQSPMDFSFIRKQRGMFSMLGINREQVLRLRDEYSIYIVDSSRINIAGISPKIIGYLADAIISVL